MKNKDTELFIRMNGKIKRKLKKLAKRAELSMSDYIAVLIVEADK